jgi:uncharacterized membrane protein YuzA (DUF378 family)
MQRHRSTALSQIFVWLAVIGALNWGLVGLFDWDLVRALFGNDTSTPSSALSRAVYAVVGVAGVALAFFAPRLRAEAGAPRLPGDVRAQEARP